jgi:hypothetical protein
MLEQPRLSRRGLLGSNRHIATIAVVCVQREPDREAAVDIDTLQEAASAAIDRTRLVVGDGNGQAVALRWGVENDIQPIRDRLTWPKGS